MKILTGIPVLYHPEICKKAIDSIINESDILIINNGADMAMRHMFIQYDNRVHFIHHLDNIYVNPAWNEILKVFIDSEGYDQLVIMNSDLVLRWGWSDYIQDGISCVPTDGSHLVDTVSYEGTTGVFIHLNKEMAKLVYPIPNGIRIWYGDTWIYEKIKRAGYQAVIRAGMLCEHIGHGSQTLKLLPERAEIIAQDQLAWVEIVKTL